MQAVNVYDTINIKALRSVFSGKIVNTGPGELDIQYGENSFGFIFRFGCIVFFNLSGEEIAGELAKIKSALGEGLPFPTSESYQINVSDSPTNVEFEYVDLKKLSLDALRLVALTLGQSAALEYFEIRADRMLADTSSFMENIAQTGIVPLYSKKLLRIIGSTASARHQIISNVAVLDPPDETWKSKELEKLHRDIQQNFDIDIRFRTLDRKITLVQDNIEIIVDLTASRRATLLEAMIVLLIVFEIAMALFKF